MKRRLALLISIIMIPLVFSACTGSANFTAGGKVNVVTTFYPLYDFVQKIGGEQVHAVNLVPAGVEPHDWTPKPRDMRNIRTADLFIYNGAGFEGWIGDFLDSIGNNGRPMVVGAAQGVNLVRAEERSDNARVKVDKPSGTTSREVPNHSDAGRDHASATERAETSGAPQDGKAESDNGDGHAPGEYDPHIWLSPRQATVMAENIRNGLVSVDPDNRATYEANFRSLIDRLRQLDERLQEIVAAAPKKEIVVSHDAFGYIARDYGLVQMGVMGLSPDAEPTVQEMKEVVEFAETHHIRYILFEELVSPRLAETLAKSLDIETLVLNPLEGLTKDQAESGEDYFSVMEDNLTTIEKALQ